MNLSNAANILRAAHVENSLGMLQHGMTFGKTQRLFVLRYLITGDWSQILMEYIYES